METRRNFLEVLTGGSSGQPNRLFLADVAAVVDSLIETPIANGEDVCPGSSRRTGDVSFDFQSDVVGHKEAVSTLTSN